MQGKEEVITQWAMGDVEAAGLLKMDFLGLRNLTILAKAVELIEQTTGERVDPYKFPLDDRETFALLCRGETKGIFQLESGGIRDLLQKMKPDHFRDIIATNALYRPGPLEGGMVDDYIQVKHGRKQAEYPHPVMKDVLEETHGVMVYQEQVMRILNRLGGIELSERLHLHQGDQQEEAADDRQVSARSSSPAPSARGSIESEADELFGMIEKFAGYGFNKSHSTAYALIAYMTAYLKAHYPVEFMAALALGRHRRPQFQEERLAGRAPGRLPADEHRRRAAGREPLATAISPSPTARSTSACAPIKGCGGAAAEAIAAAREAGGPFRDLFDFCERVDPRSRSTARRSNRSIKAGAFDSLGARRSQMHGRASNGPCKPAPRCLPIAARGQKGLFDAMDDEPPADAPRAGCCPTCPSGTTASGWPARRKCSASICRAIRWPSTKRRSTPTARTPRSKRPRLPHRTEVVLGGMICVDQVLAHQEPAARQHEHQVRDVRSGGHGRHRCAASSGRRISPTTATWSRPTRSWSCAARSTTGRAAKKPT